MRPNVPVCCDLLIDAQITDFTSVHQSVRINNLSITYIGWHPISFVTECAVHFRSCMVPCQLHCSNNKSKSVWAWKLCTSVAWMLKKGWMLCEACCWWMDRPKSFVHLFGSLWHADLTLVGWKTWFFNIHTPKLVPWQEPWSTGRQRVLWVSRMLKDMATSASSHGWSHPHKGQWHGAMIAPMVWVVPTQKKNWSKNCSSLKEWWRCEAQVSWQAVSLQHHWHCKIDAKLIVNCHAMLWMVPIVLAQWQWWWNELLQGLREQWHWHCCCQNWMEEWWAPKPTNQEDQKHKTKISQWRSNHLISGQQKGNKTKTKWMAIESVILQQFCIESHMTATQCRFTHIWMTWASSDHALPMKWNSMKRILDMTLSHMTLRVKFPFWAKSSSKKSKLTSLQWMQWTRHDGKTTCERCQWEWETVFQLTTVTATSWTVTSQCHGNEMSQIFFNLNVPARICRWIHAMNWFLQF